MGSANAVDDLQVSAEDSGQVRLSWTERNTGDYDFNGEVNIADLTPLGKHFGSAVGSGPAARLTQEYWVDGDHNGEINLADLTAIGSNYFASVAGYRVYRNGAPVGDSESAVTVPRPAGPFTNSPPAYEVVVEGLTLDEWEVRPVDSEGNEGEPSKLPGQYALTLVASTLSPPTLSQLTSLNGLDGDSVMRVILPGVVPDRIMPSNPGLVPPVPLAGGGAGFKGLEPHAGEMLYADILFAPQVDLATGAARSGPPFASPGPLGVPDEYLAVTAVPFVLSSGVPASVSASVSFSPRPSGGYFVNLASTTATGGAPVSRSVRLDYPAARVACDTDSDGDLGDEAWLADSDRDCISDRRYQQEDYNAAHLGAPRDNESFSATVVSFDEQAGLLMLSGGTTVQFSELCSFKRRLVSLAAPPPGDHVPGELKPGDSVQVSAYTYETAEPKQHWATYVELQDDPGMTLTILPQALADGGSATYLLRYFDHGNLLEAQVLAHDAQDISSIYCAVDYDPLRFKLVETALPGALRDIADEDHPFLDSGSLYNIQAATPGLRRVEYAAALGDPQSAPKLGSSGPVDAVLVSFYFYKGQAEVNPLDRSVVTDPASKPALSWLSSDPRRVAWSYANEGDFDQDGVVGPPDLRPIALRYGLSSFPAPLFPVPSLEDVLDASKDGRIDAEDAATLGIPAFRQRAVSEYRVYLAADGNANNYLLAGSLPFAAHQNDPDLSILRFEYNLAADPPEGALVKVVPVYAGVEGVASSDLTVAY